jgi:outer membrane protein OmpA-like peptidoglycan-associated protein
MHRISTVRPSPRWRLATAPLTLVLALAAAVPALAQSEGFDTQTFHPAPSRRSNHLGLMAARLLPEGAWEAGISGNYALEPFRLSNLEGDDLGSLVSAQGAVNLLFAYALHERFEIGIDIPLVVVQEGEEPGAVAPSAWASDAGFGLGDIRLVPKVLIATSESEYVPGGVSFSGVVEFFLPTGDPEAYQGEGFRVEPRLVLDLATRGGMRFSLNLGYQVRAEAAVHTVEVDDTFHAGVGADFPVGPTGEWHILGEMDANLMVLNEINDEEALLEGRLGVRYASDDGPLVELGVGRGISQGAGAPEWRFVLSASYAGGLCDDCDDDGVLNENDDCPEEREDRDDFEDGDGCPDPDNDADGILDGADECPNDAEDADGFEDADGCPDPDNDADGVLDTVDECDDAPEDLDGFEDGDGCPDPDNDRDGLLDGGDECPDAAEDFDGFEDGDGCPEEGTGLIELTCYEIVIREQVLFETGSAEISEESNELLNQVSDVLISVPYIRRMRVEGHTDDRGTDEMNLTLSDARAASVRAYLEARGVEPSRLISQGFGESMPIADNRSADGRAQNRRVVFVIVEQENPCQE